MTEFTPKDIQVQNDESMVVIRWADEHESRLPITRLRGYCPCAECQGHQPQIKWQENKTHRIFGANLVGRYAVSFQFACGHQTGIFRFEHLRKLDPAESGRWGAPEEALRCSI